MSNKNPLWEWKQKTGTSWNQLAALTGMYKGTLQAIAMKDPEHVGKMEVSSHVIILATTGVDLAGWYLESYS